jgi:peptidyl-tRNA hydrolase
MRAVRLKEIEEMAAKLLVTAGKLPAVQDRHNAFKEIGRFRERIVDPRRTELPDGCNMKIAASVSATPPLLTPAQTQD